MGMLKKANEDAGLRGIVDGKLRRMEEVKALANKMDCSIRTHILMREFGRAQKDGRTPDELKTYTTALINSCDGKKTIQRSQCVHCPNKEIRWWCRLDRPD